MRGQISKVLSVEEPDLQVEWINNRRELERVVGETYKFLRSAARIELTLRVVRSEGNGKAVSPRPSHTSTPEPEPSEDPFDLEEPEESILPFEDEELLP